MSALFQEAIVDAEKIKESAMATAKKEVISKYANEIKKNFDFHIFEQLEDFMGGDEKKDEDVPAPVQEKEAEAGEDYSEDRISEIPPAHLNDEPAGVPEDETVVFNLTDIRGDVDKAKDTIEGTKKEEVLSEPPIEEVEPEEDKNGEALLESIINHPGFEKLLSSLVEETEKSKEDDETKTDDKKGDGETEVILDMDGPNKTGWPTANSQDVKATEEYIELKKIADNKQNEVVSLGEQLLKIKNEFDQLKKVALKMNDKNVKLWYTNKVLLDGSLNERQKSEIVRALTETKGSQEAKSTYEAFMSAVGTTRMIKNAPESLREARGNRVFTVQPRHTENENVANKNTDVVFKRMRQLAQVKEKN